LTRYNKHNQTEIVCVFEEDVLDDDDDDDDDGDDWCLIICCVVSYGRNLHLFCRGWSYRLTMGSEARRIACRTASPSFPKHLTRTSTRCWTWMARSSWLPQYYILLNIESKDFLKSLISHTEILILHNHSEQYRHRHIAQFAHIDYCA
jgi:hypothetical protein